MSYTLFFLFQLILQLSFNTFGLTVNSAVSDTATDTQCAHDDHVSANLITRSSVVGNATNASCDKARQTPLSQPKIEIIVAGNTDSPATNPSHVVKLASISKKWTYNREKWLKDSSEDMETPATYSRSPMNFKIDRRNGASNRDSDNGTASAILPVELGERAYSVALPGDEIGDKMPVPWPAVEYPPEYGPADKTKKYSWVRYCFSSQSVSDWLLPVLEAAISRWAPAFKYSAMQIVPACWDGQTPKWDCLCGSDASMIPSDTLQIRDAYDDQGIRDPELGRSTTCTIGYNAHYLDDWPHQLRFYGYNREDLHDNMHELDRWEAIMIMAHELGHAMGLAHEHQRPDRDEYIHFTCENMKDYGQALSWAQQNINNFFDPSTSIEERMKLICDCPEPKYAQFMRGLGNMHKSPWMLRGGTTGDSPYDYLSIMHYGSNTFSGRKDPFLGHYTLSRKSVGRTPGPVTIFLAGSYWPNLQSISPGDVARIAELYPAGDDKLQQARDIRANGRWSSLSYEINGKTFDVRQAPDDPLRHVARPD